ncbi:hypothetical protein [Schumannella sp. 10F1B-5-1]|uniref:hypothetical protein n=1 Tax=Schumannella sp. 10F1B-5-1 TaxID=2590780 RepID=UPI0011318A07|nr:hypothetical protein [Schumannella sp. 10F1B-5-1]TPW76831.1 hypothetical protein FJ658_02515 [Schumannella sp. 10F1B-5-1]
MTARAAELEVAVARTREAIAEADAQLRDEGLLDAGDRVSARVADEPLFLITPDGLAPHGPEGFALVQDDASVVPHTPGGDVDPHAVAEHARRYRIDPGLGALVQAGGHRIGGADLPGAVAATRELRAHPPI